MQLPLFMDVSNTLLRITDFIEFQHASNEAQRLFHGRGHAYPGLHHITIDWLPPVILISLFAEENLTAIEYLADKLRQTVPNCQSIQCQRRYLTNGPVEIVWGESIQDFQITENSLKFHIRLGKNKNAGLFLDMRNGRQWVKEHSRGKRVLNLFAYTCGFSVAAIAGQAASVLNVDMNSNVLNLGRQNHRLNQQDLSKVRFQKLDIFKSFGRLKRCGPFDLLICDPPTFQKGSVDIARDYPKIIRRLDEFMAKDSQLMLCLNAPDLTRDFLLDIMHTEARDYWLCEEISAPDVFKETKNKGLKILCFIRKN
jgi:23S rRNA (cytosine1962-C5)-methyltransferase